MRLARTARSPKSRLSSAFALGLLTSVCFVVPVACGSGKPFSGATEPEAGAAGRDDGQTPAGTSSGAGSAGSPAAGGSSSGGNGSAGTAGTESSSGGDAASAGGGDAADAGSNGGPTTCAKACENPKPYCADVNGTPTCVNPAQALSGKRLELPCVASEDAVAQLCPTIADRATACPVLGKLVKQTLELSGDPSVLYSVTLHIRGVVEPRSYVGGKDAGNHFYVGGTGQQPSNYNMYSIVVSAPAQTFYLNADTKAEGYRVLPLDHEKAIVVQGGASISLQIFDPDCAMVKNCQSFDGPQCTPYVVAGIPPAPQAFNGQFVQLDVVGVAPAN